VVVNKLKKEKEFKSPTFLKLFPRTHILIHGYGSAGKAGFALKLLLTPPVDKGVETVAIKKSNYSNSIFRRKILIISFLYPQKYYQELIYDKVELHKTVKKNYPYLQDPIIDYLIY